MAQKRIAPERIDKCPDTLNDNAFYGIELDEKQKEFRDAIWDDNYDIIFCNSVAGTGKTLIAVATANLLVQYRKYDGIVYVISNTQEERIGFLPGDIASKVEPYTAPLYDALYKIGVNPNVAINQMSILNSKEGTGYIDAISHTYLRGCNLERKVVIIEESQNFYLDELKKTLTRIHDTSKTIVIGHSGQCDLYKNPERSGFSTYLKHFEGKSRCKVCSLEKNYRGWVSNWADNLNF